MESIELGFDHLALKSSIVVYKGHEYHRILTLVSL